jgi:hypothetical protein
MGALFVVGVVAAELLALLAAYPQYPLREIAAMPMPPAPPEMAWTKPQSSPPIPTAKDIADEIEKRRSKPDRSHIRILKLEDPHITKDGRFNVHIEVENDGASQADVSIILEQLSILPFPESVEGVVAIEDSQSEKLEKDFARREKIGVPALVGSNEYPPGEIRFIESTSQFIVNDVLVNSMKNGSYAVYLSGILKYFDHGNSSPRYARYCKVYHDERELACHKHNQQP